jgi:hypothetical protein
VEEVEEENELRDASFNMTNIDERGTIKAEEFDESRFTIDQDHEDMKTYQHSIYKNKNTTKDSYYEKSIVIKKKDDYDPLKNIDFSKLIFYFIRGKEKRSKRTLNEGKKKPIS